jgi:hypothetical protein
MSCRDCNDLCRQGRDCPHRLTWTDYQMRYYNLIEDIKKWISKIIRSNQKSH